jgi:hypothetical protein
LIHRIERHHDIRGDGRKTCRLGVLGKQCGHRLQLRLMRAIEVRARLNGRGSIISDTTDHMHSANNFIRVGIACSDPRIPEAGRIRFIGARKIAASAHQKFSIRPVGGAAAGPFLRFGSQRLVAQ